MYRPIASRRRRVATAALWILVIMSGTGVTAPEVLAWSGGPSWEHLVALLSGLFLYADPFHRIWPRRRVMVADLPRLRRELSTRVPNAPPETIRRG